MPNAKGLKATLPWAAIMLAGALAVGFVAMTIHNAHAAEHWKVTVEITSKDGEKASFTHGTRGLGPRYFDSEEACKAALKDPKDLLAEIQKALAAQAKKIGAKVGPFTCKLDLAKNEI